MKGDLLMIKIRNGMDKCPEKDLCNICPLNQTCKYRDPLWSNTGGDMNEVTLIAIDPSMRNLGYALYTIDRGLATLQALGSTHMQGNTVYTWQKYAYDMACKSTDVIAVEIESYLAERVVIVTELQEVFSGAKGQMSMDAGAIQKLYFFTGAMVRCLSALPRVEGVWGVTPTHWKGQINKTVSMRRAQSIIKAGLGETKPDIPHDTAEAVLIGKYAATRIQYGMETVDFTHPISCIYHRFTRSNNQVFESCVY